MTEDDILTHVRTFLLGALARDIEIVQGQINRVVAPAVPDYIVMTPAGRQSLSTTTDRWGEAAVAIRHDRSLQVDVQLDIHGPNAADNSSLIVVLWRDDYACRALVPFGIQPLHATDAQQLPFVNAENQYENRWSMTLALQANTVVSTPMTFADKLSPVSHAVA